MKLKSSPLLFVGIAFLSATSLNPATAADSQIQPVAEATTQQKAVENEQDKKKDEEVVRISVTLVQIDAVVTDEKGKQVTDLKADDFEIYEDNRRQRITNFSYVIAQPTSTEMTANRTARPTPAAGLPGPPVRLRADQVRRTIALVVDDLGMSFESIQSVQGALKKFVDQQMQPGDLVAILRTGAGMGALQQFTSDKRLLHSAIDRVRFNLMGGGGLGAFTPISSAPFAGAGGLGAAQMRQSIAQTATTRAETFAIGTLGALEMIVRGLKDLPGRKSVILMSDGFQLTQPGTGQANLRVLDPVRKIVDLANRASVVIYSIDPRGLQYTGLTAADNTAFQSINDVNSSIRDRGNHLFETQGGLNYIAHQTGGLFFKNTNSIPDGINRVLDDQKGYYLLGYVPEEATFKAIQGRRTYHSITVKLKKSGLRVRSRTGFFGVADEESGGHNDTPAQKLASAITSPFTAGDIHLKLTSLFGHEAKTGSFMRSIMHIDARDIFFTQEQDGQRKGTLEIAAFTFGSNGEVVGREARGYNLSVRADGFQKLLDQGFVYAINVPIKKPGGYQLRVAVRDPRADRVGSASQFIDVPDLGADRLTLSGLVVSGYDPATATKSTGTPDRASSEGAVESIDPASTPAVRILKRGTFLDYGFLIYNAQLDAKTKKPQLESQLILLKDGKQVFATKVSPVTVGNEPDWKHIPVSGRLRLGDDLVLGEYILQVVVTDKLAKQKYSVGSQWMDFELIK